MMQLRSSRSTELSESFTVGSELPPENAIAQEITIIEPKNSSISENQMPAREPRNAMKKFFIRVRIETFQNRKTGPAHKINIKDSPKQI